MTTNKISKAQLERIRKFSRSILEVRNILTEMPHKDYKKLAVYLSDNDYGGSILKEMRYPSSFMNLLYDELNEILKSGKV